MSAIVGWQSTFALKKIKTGDTALMEGGGKEEKEEQKASLVEIDALNVVFWKSRTRGHALAKAKGHQIVHGYASPAGPRWNM
jgi:hypothetical protein